jgi:RHS repeat-associated protein
MAWDFRDQLQMTQSQAVGAGEGERTWYVYDAAGQRVRKVTELACGAVKEERIYLAGFEIYRRPGSAPLRRETLHVMDDKRRLTLVETRVEGDDGSPRRLVRYQLANHLGSSVLELGDRGQVISYEEFAPNGATSYQAVSSHTHPPKRYRYLGKERDEETGLAYHGARYYAPWLGRWTASDPSGMRDGVNTYSYVNGNPISRIDLTGNFELSWKSVAIGAAIAIVTVAVVAVTAGAGACTVTSSSVSSKQGAVSNRNRLWT